VIMSGSSWSTQPVGLSNHLAQALDCICSRDGQSLLLDGDSSSARKTCQPAACCCRPLMSYASSDWAEGGLFHGVCRSAG
jgi:hypothetical protein